MKKIGLALFFLALLYFGVCWFCATLILNPPDRSIEETAVIIQEKWGRSMASILAEMPAVENFTIALDGDKQRTITGWWFKAEKQEAEPSKNCLVIMAHGWNNTRAGMLKYVPLIEDCDCDIVLYDHRAHNESYGKFGTGGIKEGADLLALTRWFEAKDFDAHQIGWIGGSWGAAAVLEAGAERDDLAFILADSPFQDWETAITERAVVRYGTPIKAIVPTSLWLMNLRAGINYREANAAEAASQNRSPVFLIHSSADIETASSQSVAIAARLPEATSEFHHTDWDSPHTLDVVLHTEKFKALFAAFLQEQAPDFGRCNTLVDSL